jgi:hypothetical protein
MEKPLALHSTLPHTTPFLQQHFFPLSSPFTFVNEQRLCDDYEGRNLPGIRIKAFMRTGITE